jgi:hypothetical protein
MIMLRLGPETEHLLQEKAARRGQSLEAYLQGLAEREAHHPNCAAQPNVETSAADLRVERWRAWAQRHPTSVVVTDDSRESIW